MASPNFRVLKAGSNLNDDFESSNEEKDIVAVDDVGIQEHEEEMMDKMLLSNNDNSSMMDFMHRQSIQGLESCTS